MLEGAAVAVMMVGLTEYTPKRGRGVVGIDFDRRRRWGFYSIRCMLV